MADGENRIFTAGAPTKPQNQGAIAFDTATSPWTGYVYYNGAWQAFGSAGIPPVDITLTNTHILVGNASNLAADVAMSGDATLANTGAITVTKSNGVAFGSAAFVSSSSFDAAGAAAAAQAAAEAASDPAGSAATAQANAETYTDTKLAGSTGTIQPPAIILHNHKIIKGNGSTQGQEVDDLTTVILVLDGGGAAIANGTRFNSWVDFAGTIEEVTVLADQTGSLPLDIQTCGYANYNPGTHPVSADSITGAAPPSIVTAAKYQDASLTGWATALAAGTCISLTATGAATSITRVTCALKVAKS